MTDRDPLLYHVELLSPRNVLDVGCGCGAFTAELAQFCSHITAIDISEPLLERSRKENGRPNINYQCMDGRQLDFPPDHFDLVLIRHSIHHVRDWQNVIDEMLRVSADKVLIEEPLDDPRSDAKRNTMLAQSLFLEIQAEVGFSHFPYVRPEHLATFMEQKHLDFEIEITRCETIVQFDEFFEPWKFFADKSARKDYWLKRLQDFRSALGSGPLCETDTFLATIRKKLLP